MKNFIVYYRVSTKKQEKTRLGLGAQKIAVERFVAAEKGQILAEFTEVETGKDASRPKLAEACRHAVAAGATLVVAKLDRLARNMAFTSALMDSGLDFVALDCPYASRLTLHILAAVAEDEARRISERTKAGLAVLKARGVKLGAASPNSAFRRGTPRGWKAAGERARQARAARLVETYGPILPTMRAMRDAGQSLEQVAAWLNREGYRTTRNSCFTRATVCRALARTTGMALAPQVTQAA
jgi:DNA invertase Pin-like site-specific DNA recombinase